jgi:hypothetical protein
MIVVCTYPETGNRISSVKRLQMGLTPTYLWGAEGIFLMLKMQGHDWPLISI